MEIMSAIFYREWQYIKRMGRKQILLLLISTIILPFMIYLNNTPLALVHYDLKTLEALSMLFLIFAPLFTTMEIVTQSMISEKRDFMIDFILSQGINKVQLMISKMCLPFFFSMIGLTIAILEYKLFIVPSLSLFLIIKILIMGILASLISILISMLMFFFVNSRPESYILASTLVNMGFISVTFFVTNPIAKPFVLFIAFGLVSFIVLFIVNYFVFCKREAFVHFEEF